MDEGIVAIFIVGTIFAAIVAIIVGPSYLKSRERREIQTTVRTAIDKGQPLPPEVIEALSKDITKNLPSRTKDIRRGIIWVSASPGSVWCRTWATGTGATISVTVCWGSPSFRRPSGWLS